MTDSHPIRVLLVDDHAVVRSGLGAVLSTCNGIILAGEAGNGQEAIDLCDKLKPDIVLMDLMMPVMDGVTATADIHKKWPNINIIALTSFKEKEMVEGALKAGAMSYLLKNISAAELITAIRGAVSGQSRLSPEAAQVLIQDMKHSTTPVLDLTDREKEILALMVDGLGNGDIADRLVVSQSTVKFHVSNILSKLGATSRTEAVVMALKNNLLK
jgi:NarL family two-component system response regulator LiaR